MRLSGLLSTSTGSRFRRNFFKVARANLIAMVLPILATPILTRLFLPSDYGVLAIFSSILAFLAAFCTWRLDWVLPNAKTETMAASLMAAGLVVLLLTCLVVLAAVLLVDPSIFGETLTGHSAYLLFLLPVALGGAGLRHMFSGWFVRQGDLTAVSRATIVQSVANVAAGIGAGLSGLGAPGLIGATVIATWAGIGTLLRQAGQHLADSLRRVSPRTLRASIRRHGRNANWSTLVSIVNAASLNAPVLVLAYFFLPREIGWYALMHRLVAAPTGALAAALGQSFWSQAAEYARANRIVELSRLYLKTTLRLGIACIPVAAVCLAGPVFVGPLLGADEWGGAGYVLMAMTPLFVGSILFSPTNHLVVLDKQRLQLFVDITRLVLVLGSIVLANHFGFEFVTAVALVSISSFVGHALLFFIHLRMHKAYERN